MAAEIKKNGELLGEVTLSNHTSKMVELFFEPRCHKVFVPEKHEVSAPAEIYLMNPDHPHLSVDVHENKDGSICIVLWAEDIDDGLYNVEPTLIDRYASKSDRESE